jgi:cell wall-associated NlpC family hydrolase
MSPAYKDAVERSYNELLYAHPSIKYVWGADKPYEGKADCSGLIYGIWKKAAIPGVKRTTALFMQQGKDGWPGVDVDFYDLDSTDLLWWTWKNKDGSLTNPTRPHGHIGVVVLSRTTGLLEVYHASTSKKAAVVQQIRGKMLTDISSKKRMIHGEKNGSKGKR